MFSLKSHTACTFGRTPDISSVKGVTRSYQTLAMSSCKTLSHAFCKDRLLGATAEQMVDKHQISVAELLAGVKLIDAATETSGTAALMVTKKASKALFVANLHPKPLDELAAKRGLTRNRTFLCFTAFLSRFL